MGIDLAGRVVVVTGGNRGIGLGIARAVAEAGADVAIWGRDADRNAEAAERLAATGRRVHAATCDVTDEDRVAAAMDATIEALGPLDAFVANAGVGGALLPYADVTLEEWRRVMTVDLDGVFLSTREAVRRLIEHRRPGALVLVSSTSAIHGAARNVAYGTAKTGLLGLTRALAVELARHHIRVNALLPGWTITELAEAAYADDRFRAVTTRRTPVRRWAEPADMGPAAVFLCDPTIEYHTGDHLVVDGGYTVF